jgi:3-dehydroquinate dehydratase/shikimate dehydrogenase
MLAAVEWIVSLTPEVAHDPLAALASPPERAAAVELRADLFPGLDLGAAIRACPLPVLVTLRSTAEGGCGPDDPGARETALEAARDAGAALLDLEAARDLEFVRRLGLESGQIVLSWHDPAGTPPRLAEIAEQWLSHPARWIKVVPTARGLHDIEAVLGLHTRFNACRRAHRRLIGFSMGVPGIASRYLAPLLGPSVSYAAWRKGASAAPGQLTVDEIDFVIGHLGGPPKRLYGIVGADASRSLSPRMHAAAYRSLGLPYLTVPVSVPDPEELGEIFVPAGATCFDRVGLPARGWAVTTPYKARAAAAATLSAPRVGRAGAANTLILDPARVVAENTDADGAVGALTGLGIDPAGRTAVVQGTGGAARGAAVGLHLAGARVALRSRSDERAEATAAEIAVDWCAAEGPAPEGSILVNATPLGRGPDDPAPFAEAEIASAVAVVDMVYGDRTPSLVRRARDAGVPVIDGREFLLYQGIAQLAAFTQTIPPREAMRAAITDDVSR